MNKTSKVFGSLVLPGAMVLAIGLLFALSNLSLAQQGAGWPALPDAGEPPALKPSPSPSDTPKKVVEAPASPVVTTTPSVVTPTPSPSEDKGKKDDEVAKKGDDDDHGKKAEKVVEAPASPVVTTTPSVVTPTPSPSEDKGKKGDDGKKKS